MKSEFDKMTKINRSVSIKDEQNYVEKLNRSPITALCAQPKCSFLYFLRSSDALTLTWCSSFGNAEKTSHNKPRTVRFTRELGFTEIKKTLFLFLP